MEQGSSKSPGALVWGLAGAMARKDGQERRTAGRRNSTGKGGAAGQQGSVSTMMLPQLVLFKKKQSHMYPSKS